MSVVSNPPSRRAAPGVTAAEAAARLAPLWRELLRLDQVGWDDDYFDLGGDSVLAVELFARIEREFGRKLPLATLFDAPTVGRLAEVLAEGPPAAGSCLVPIQPAGRSRPLFLVHDGTGEVLCYRTLARRLGTERPVYGFQWAGRAAEAGALTVEALATHYVQELQRAQPQGPYYLGGYCGGGTVAYEMAQQFTA
ncbi:MAG: thioesterase domain-containing protein, partial [Terriglobales bacterium]